MPHNSIIAIQPKINKRKQPYFYIRLKQNLSKAPAVYESVKKILVFSNIDGNFDALRKLLIKARIIDQSYQWIFGDGHLVILGDCFGQINLSIECLWLIYSLEEKAQKEGGLVHFILGKQEVTSLNGDWRYHHPNYANNTRSKKFINSALFSGNNEINRWLHTRNILEKIGNTLFIHGAISPEMLKLSLTIEEINNQAMAGIASEKHPIFTILNKNEPHFLYAMDDNKPAMENEIEDTFAKFGITRIVTAQIQVEKIRALYNDKVININIDHSQGKSEALLIRKNKCYKVNLSGGKISLK